MASLTSACPDARHGELMNCQTLMCVCVCEPVYIWCILPSLYTWIYIYIYICLWCVCVVPQCYGTTESRYQDAEHVSIASLKQNAEAAPVLPSFLFPHSLLFSLSSHVSFSWVFQFHPLSINAVNCYLIFLSPPQTFKLSMLSCNVSSLCCRPLG